MGLFLPRRSVESLFRAIAMAKRLYVGNLKYTVTSAQLQELFEQYGTVSTRPGPERPRDRSEPGIRLRGNGQ